LEQEKKKKVGIGSLLDVKHWWTSLTASSKGYFVTDTEVKLGFDM
jgi:hypothetical protein